MCADKNSVILFIEIAFMIAEVYQALKKYLDRKRLKIAIYISHILTAVIYSHKGSSAMSRLLKSMIRSTKNMTSLSTWAVIIKGKNLSQVLVLSCSFIDQNVLWTPLMSLMKISGTHQTTESLSAFQQKLQTWHSTCKGTDLLPEWSNSAVRNC